MINAWPKESKAFSVSIVTNKHFIFSRKHIFIISDIKAVFSYKAGLNTLSVFKFAQYYFSRTKVREIKYFVNICPRERI